MNVDKHLIRAQANRAIEPEGNHSRPDGDPLINRFHILFAEQKQRNPTVRQNPTACANHENILNKQSISSLHHKSSEADSPPKKNYGSKTVGFFPPETELKHGIKRPGYLISGRRRAIKLGNANLNLCRQNPIADIALC